MKTDKEAMELMNAIHEAFQKEHANTSPWLPYPQMPEQWAIDAICKHKEESRWIPVDVNNLPDFDVIAINNHEHIMVGTLTRYGNKLYCISNHEYIINVTHYQLKPPPPQTNK